MPAWKLLDAESLATSAAPPGPYPNLHPEGIRPDAQGEGRSPVSLAVLPSPLGAGRRVGDEGFAVR
jgi:hypothetical protein